MKTWRVFLSGILLVTATAQAKDLGTWGDLYPITEPDLLTTIHQRLEAMEESGELAKKQDEFKQRVIEHTLRPTPVNGLAIAQKDRTWFVDPTFTVSQDIKDARGVVFAHRGQKVNPLESVPFVQTLYFIDADDARQVAWMRAQKPATDMVKVILVKGDIREATQALDTRIYFDQEGVLTQKFNLKAVPARVTAAKDGKRLQVDEFAVEGQP